MRHRKIDHNQREIVAALRRIGASVALLSMVGNGVPDIAVGFRKLNWFFEIKHGDKPKSRKQLTPKEKNFHKSWQGQIAIVENWQDAFRVIGATS